MMAVQSSTGVHRFRLALRHLKRHSVTRPSLSALLPALATILIALHIATAANSQPNNPPRTKSFPRLPNVLQRCLQPSLPPVIALVLERLGDTHPAASANTSASSSGKRACARANAAQDVPGNHVLRGGTVCHRVHARISRLPLLLGREETRIVKACVTPVFRFWAIVYKYLVPLRFVCYILVDAPLWTRPVDLVFYLFSY